MIVCRIENLSRNYTADPVFEGLNLQIESGERIGLVGPNGAGKTTLMRVLNRQDPPDSGAIHFHPSARVSFLTQFPDFADDATLRSEVRKAMSHLEQMVAQMIEAGEQMAVAQDDIQRGKWSRTYDQLQEDLRRHGGYDFNHRIEEVLFGLGFSEGDFDRSLDTFSGGQQSRVLLARLLLAAPDLMLLDEPTNHLDIDTTEWLEDYLSRQHAAMVIVSHDRYFLDKTANVVWEMHGGRVTTYPGNYAAYVKQREERQKVAERVSTKQKETIAHYEEFVTKNRYGQLAKQAKSREKMIARIEEDLVETISDIRGPTMAFGAATRTGDIVLSAKELSKAFGDNKLFGDVNFEIERGQRFGIIGANGSGKTTLLRMLLGEEAVTTGIAKLGHNVKVGYLDQYMDVLDPESTPLQAVRPPWRASEKPEPFRALLARFGIGADLCENRIGSLSGGEKTRVALARISSYEINLLALDEPTNHLDLWAREALEKAVLEFDGTVVVVSHDRFFLNRTVERLLLVAEGGVRLIPGNYDRYQQFKKERADAAAAATKSSKPTGKPEAASKTGDKPKRKYPFRKVSDIEADIAAREGNIAELETQLLRPEIYKDGRKAHELNQSLARLKAELEQLFDHWSEAVEMNPA